MINIRIFGVRISNLPLLGALRGLRVLRLQAGHEFWDYAQNPFDTTKSEPKGPTIII